MTSGQLTRAQVETLLRPIKPKRVLQANGQSHIPAYDIAAHLNRIFGFGGWEKEILDLRLVTEAETTTKGYEGKPGKPAWAVTYSCTMRLTIKDPSGVVVARYEDGACGSSTQPQRGEAHDMALKSAISYALKRCAKDLGDQFGLSLYNGGQVTALVCTTLVMPGEEQDEAIDVEASVPAPVSLGNDERQDPAEQGAPERVLERQLHAPSSFDPADPFALGEDPTPAPASAPNVRARAATKGQIGAIHQSIKSLGTSDEAYRKQLRNLYGVESSKDLTYDQATDLISRLQAKLAEVA